MNKPINTSILIVDDHPIVREGIRTLLTSAIPHINIYEATEGQEALQHVKAKKTDIVIVDLEIPGIDGFQLIETIAVRPFAPRIIVYTMHEEPWTIVKLQQSKVNAIVLKGDNPTEIITAVESVKARLPYYSQRYASLIELNQPALTQREVEVLILLSKGFSSHQIADTLFVSENTIEYHRKQILRRLEARNNVHAITIALQKGIIPPFSTEQ